MFFLISISKAIYKHYLENNLKVLEIKSVSRDLHKLPQFEVVKAWARSVLSLRFLLRD